MADAGHKVTVLVVEDEREIARFVCSALTDAGFQVFEADTCRSALTAAGTRKPDIIILDLGLPDRDGVDFIREVRTWSAVPILVLSARVEETEKIRALDAGADDYVEKPFGMGELIARVRASLRRAQPKSEGNASIMLGEVCVDPAHRRVTRNGAEIHLTPTEYRLLMVLLGHPGKVLTYRHLLREVWGPEFVEHNHYLRIYMGNLRHKLEADPTQPEHLITETGVGYRLVL